MTLFALREPNGTLIEETVSSNAGDSWDHAFDHLSENGCGNLLARDRDGMEREHCPPDKSLYYARRFWKRLKASREYARRHGYNIVPVQVSEIATLTR